MDIPTFSRLVTVFYGPGAKALGLLKQLHTETSVFSLSISVGGTCCIKTKQVVGLTQILDSVCFKTVLKEISLRPGFDKMSYQQNMKCGKSSGKDKYTIGLHMCRRSLDLIIVSIQYVFHY